MQDNSYSYIKEEIEDLSNIYSFITSQQLVYRVYFSADDYVEYLDKYPKMLHYGYAIGFYKSNTVKGVKYKQDSRVRETICKIITDFFQVIGPELVLLYHCDRIDGRQGSRNAIFIKWFDGHKASIDYQKYCVKVELPKPDGNIENNYLGYIVSNANPHINEIKNEFESFISRISTEK